MPHHPILTPRSVSRGISPPVMCLCFCMVVSHARPYNMQFLFILNDVAAL